MDTHGWIAVATLVVATVLFFLEVAPLAYVALAIPVVLAVTGVVSAQVALSGFGNHAVISIAATFVVAMGLRESGVATLLARGMERVGGASEARLMLLVILVTCTVSAF